MKATSIVLISCGHEYPLVLNFLDLPELRLVDMPVGKRGLEFDGRLYAIFIPISNISK
jgi:hypothetical protein